ncbi:MAG: magnesium/cobalt transporter CorA [Longimicrobiaceae bacterium]
MKTPRSLFGGMQRRARRPPPGTAPGTLIPEPDTPPAVISAIGYGPEGFDEWAVEDPASLAEARERWPVLWVNVDGACHVPTLEALGSVFGLHRLALEDVANVPQRPKAEWYDEHLFVVGRMIRLLPALDVEQISMFVAPGYVLTFQERPGDPLDPVRRRLRVPHGRIRSTGADYLAYAILDAITDHYFPVLESYGDELETLETCILAGSGRLAMARLHAVKRDLLALRKSIWPVRDAITALLRDPGELIGEGTQVYLRDCHDHVVQAADLVETYRDLASSLTDLYLSSVSYRMNEVMKVLTIFTAVFIPLSFIAGLYGMNFDRSESPLNMPELDWYFGYPFALGLMAVIAAGLLFYFWRRGWIGNRDDDAFVDADVP